MRHLFLTAEFCELAHCRAEQVEGVEHGRRERCITQCAIDDFECGWIHAPTSVASPVALGIAVSAPLST